MFHIEDQIELYADPAFNPKVEAQRFFASNAEAEVTRKLNEMSGVQRNVEEILKKKVRSNYALFLHANEEIHRIGFEINDLKKQVEGTQAIIQTIRTFEHGLGEAKAMRHNSLIPKIKEKHKIEREESDKISAKHEFVDVPDWLLTTPDDIARCIVEKQFQRATDCVVKAREFIDSVRHGRGNSQLAVAVTSIEEQLNVQVEFLTTTILQCMSQLTHSALWGEYEHNRRLKMLIILGCEKLASDSFCSSQSDLIRRAVRTVESTGDPLLSVSMISSSFFKLLLTVSQSFLELFGDKKNDSAKIALLLPWAHGQMQAYVSVFANQMHLGAHEASALVFVGMRQGSAHLAARVVETGTAVNATPFKSSQPKPEEEDDELPITIHKDGPLAFISECIDKAFGNAAKIDAIGLRGVAGLGILLVPEISIAIRTFTDEMIRELSNQMRQDMWQGQLPSSLMVNSPVKSQKLPSKTNTKLSKSNGDIDTAQISCSYDWLTRMCNHYFEEAWILLNPSGDNQAAKMTRIPSSLSLVNNNNQKSTFGQQPNLTAKFNGYTRADICECEPVLVASILRVVVKYCMELERVDTKSLNQTQFNCFSMTVKAVIGQFLPSIGVTIESMLYFEDFGENGRSLQSVLATLSGRLARLTIPKQGSPSK